MAEFFLLQEDGSRLEQDDNQLNELLLEDGFELDHEGYDFLLLNVQMSRITQAVVMALVGEVPSSRITQCPVLILAQDIPFARITQVPVLVLADNKPCIQRWAQCWKITRLDGVVLGFTTHDEAINYANTEFSPCGSLDGSAMEIRASLGEIGDQELSGLITDSRVTAADLAGGVYQGAHVEVWLYPWSNSGGEIPVKLGDSIIGSVTQGETSYTAQALSLGELLSERALLETVTPTCRYIFGDARCTVDLVPLQHDGAATGIVLPSTRINASARVFNDSAVADADGYYDGGRLVWLTGANAGQSSEIKSYAAQQFIVWDPFLNPIQIGDTYRATPGCNLSKTDCKDRWSNYINFGGFPDIPGQDVVSQTPDSKG